MDDILHGCLLSGCFRSWGFCSCPLARCLGSTPQSLIHRSNQRSPKRSSIALPFLCVFFGIACDLVLPFSCCRPLSITMVTCSFPRTTPMSRLFAASAATECLLGFSPLRMFSPSQRYTVDSPPENLPQITPIASRQDISSFFSRLLSTRRDKRLHTHFHAQVFEPRTWQSDYFRYPCKHRYERNTQSGELTICY